MRRGARAFILAAAAALGACATPAVVFVNQSYSSAKIRRVAMGEVSDYPGVAGSGDIAAGEFEKYLLQAGYSVVERRQVEQVMREQSIDSSDSVDPATIRKVGKLLGVDALVFGGVSDFTGSRDTTVMEDLPQQQVDPVFGRVVTVQHQGDQTVRTEQQVVTGYATTTTNTIVPVTESLPAHAGLSVRLVSVDSAEMLWSASASSDGGSLDAALDSASAAIIKTLSKKLKQ